MGERGTATVGKIDFVREVVEDAAALCDAQIERLGDQIEGLVEELYGDQEWPEGTEIPLDYPEECSFCGQVLERPWQEHAGRNRAFICSTCIRDAALQLKDDVWPDWFRPGGDAVG